MAMSGRLSIERMGRPTQYACVHGRRDGQLPAGSNAPGAVPRSKRDHAASANDNDGISKSIHEHYSIPDLRY
jgi:hypothetical protein